MSVTANMTKNDIIEFLKNNLNLNITQQFIEKELDGEAVLLLRIINIRASDLGLAAKDRSKLIRNLDKDFLKLKDNINQDELYIQVFNEDLNSIWNSFDDKISNLKLGEKLKFIKYLLIRDPPPEIDKKDELFIYLKKVLRLDVSIIERILIEELISSDEETLKDIFEDLNISNDYEIFKIKIIIELIKQNKTKNQENSVNNLNLNIKEKGNEKNDNLNQEETKLDDSTIDNKKEEENQIIIENEETEEYIYSVIEVYDYDTSQNEYTKGFKNPIDEFENICNNFNIDYSKEKLTYINYEQAYNINLTSYMLWGSKEGLKKYFTEKNINLPKVYFFNEGNNNIQNDYFIEKKEGIYLYIKTDKKQKEAYIIVWPGNLIYKYYKINEPNNSLLLTLVRFGFSLSSNSILCLSDEEINNFDYNGYQIFINEEEAGFKATTHTYDFNDEKKDIEFKLENETLMNLDEIFNKKIINNLKLKSNCLFCEESFKDDLNKINTHKKFSDFIKGESCHDFYFDDDFSISNDLFYELIRSKIYLLDFLKDQLYYDKKSLDDILRVKINKHIDDLFKKFSDDIIEGTFIKDDVCYYCKNNENFMDLYFEGDIYFHKSCRLSNHTPKNEKFFNNQDNKLIDKKNLEKYKEFKVGILKKESYLKNLFPGFFKELEKKFPKLNSNGYFSFGFNLITFNELKKENNYKIDGNIFKTEIYLLKNKAFDYISSQQVEKDKIIKNETAAHNDFIDILDKDDLLDKRKKNIIKKLNDYFKNNKNNIDKWIILKNCKKLNNNKYYIYYEIVQRNIKENFMTYKIVPYNNDQYSNDFSGLILKENRKLEVPNNKYIIQDYFLKKYNTDLIVKKNNNNKKIEIKINKTKIEVINNLYDYDRNNDTLIICKVEKSIIKVQVFSNNQIVKSFPCTNFSENSKLNKIMLIPCPENSKKQSFLLFIDNEIYATKISDESNYPKYIDLGNYCFEDFKFIINFDFLLALKFDLESKKWEGKVYSLNLNNNEELFNIIGEINIDENENTEFSIFEINTRKYLIAVNLKDKKPIFKYWEIISNISGISTNYSSNAENNSQYYEIPLGNCIMNYFFHSFEKYPLMGAIQFNRKDDLSLKLDIFVGKEYINKKNYLQDYINELIKQCEKDKDIYFRDINFCFISENCKFKENNSSIGDLMIKILEITPIQIAKIIDNKFVVMSNWTNIEKMLRIEKDYNPKAYSEIINFCIKDSIFEFFDYPVIVICCFGTQSIGKSTFLNELTGSLFNVSGMRCTEGIWMSIKIFKGRQIILKEKCNKICQHCKNPNNKCCLYLAHINECFCENCICHEECVLKSCKNKCCLPKNHKLSIKCSYNNCKCECKCNCSCQSNSHHEHRCQKCQKEKKNKCECKCTCAHLCDIPIINHNFICVSLDFEGLGTFERKEEQDIQMALVGSAIGNNIIFRIGNSFDKFTQNILDKMSKGSRKIQFMDIDQFFGGSLYFSPKDITFSEKSNLEKEFVDKIKPFIINWKGENNDSSRKSYNILGLFSDWIFMATPAYKKKSFYETLRKEGINNVIEKTRKFNKHPIYKKGKDFSENLKLFLTVTYMNNYDILKNYRYNKVDEYIKECGYNPFEICGILKLNYENMKDNKKILLIEKNGIKLYINDKMIQNLEVDLNNKREFIVNNSLLLDNLALDPTKFINGTFESDIKEYNIKIKISKFNKNEINFFWVEIFNLIDFGLILKIPDEISEIITKKDLCFELYKIWDEIARIICFNEKDASINFKKFVNIIIERRNNNVDKWFGTITDDFRELKNQYHNIYNIYSEDKTIDFSDDFEIIGMNNDSNIYQLPREKHDSILNSYWKFCAQKCKKCFNKCYLTQSHKEEHQCFYDHKCKSKCEMCSKSKCQDKNCSLNCTIPLSHPDSHSCGHFHQCNEICLFKEETTNCKGRCILELDHKDKHFCGLVIHHCKRDCNLKGLSRNCNEKCNLPFPHEGKEHSCENIHLCSSEECAYKENSEGCKRICKKLYGHIDEHICEGNHVCKEECHLKGKAIGCGEKCSLEYPHKGEHNCKKEHKCNRDCIYKDKCNQKCNLIYGHDKNDFCGNVHYCKEKCNFFDCNGKCSYQFPHPDKNEHLCKDKKEHFCYLKCHLKNKSKNCENKCKYKFGHEPPCICKIKKEAHICNKKCLINKNCGRDCILPAGHNGDCLCGNCNCREPCRLKDCSRNCNEKCQYKAGHSENDPHFCNSDHLCKEKCIYKENSRNCEGICNKKYGHSGDHICNESLIHECNKECMYSNTSRNCEKKCYFKAGHETIFHMCNTKQHLCKEICYLFDKSKGCQKLCKLPINHPGPHICSLKKEYHICNNICSLSSGTKKSCCKLACSLPVEHDGNCYCEIKKESHICNKKCDLCNDNCSLITSLVKIHENHICSLEPNLHKCRKECSLKGKTRTKGECLGICGNYYNHKGNCLCKDNIHLCTEDCHLKGKIGVKGCKEKCNKPYGHQLINNEPHDCNIKHLCSGKCFYISEVGETENCGKACCLEYKHKEKCICATPYKHVCNKKCVLNGKTNGCNGDCKLKYGHDGNHKCDIEFEAHTCKSKCQLCKGNSECGHVFDHYYTNKLKCKECNNKICQLGKKGHLCGLPHDCDEECEKIGICWIEPNVRRAKTMLDYNSKAGQVITYESVTNFEIADKKKCMEKIPKNKFSHSGKHNCKSAIHLCGFKCEQCEYYCTEPYNHDGLHKGTHGNIKNSHISVSNKNNIKYAEIIKDNKTYDLMDGEEVKIFYCDEYCLAQGQGHTHLFESKQKIQHEDVKLVKSSWFSDYIYECKCSYYWENILKFQSKYFKDNDKNKFALCNWKCQYVTHPKENPEYCQLELWHKHERIVPDNLKGGWIYKGHLFKCNHSIGIYTFFLLDISGSMSLDFAVPINKKIKDKKNNMLGAAIEAIENYCKKRAGNSLKDKCALISFNDNSEKIFENYSVEQSDLIVDTCLERLKPFGGTKFKKAFEIADEIIKTIDRKEIAPIIILLTDGLDDNPSETLSFLEKVR